MTDLKLEEFKYNYFVDISDVKIDDKLFSEKFSNSLFLYLNMLEDNIIGLLFKQKAKALIEKNIPKINRNLQNSILNDLFLGFTVSFIKKNDKIYNIDNLKEMISEIGSIYFSENKKTKLLGLSFNDFFIMLIPTHFLKSEIKDFIKN